MTSTIEQIPQISLEQSIKNLGILIDGTTGVKCPRCSQMDFWKAGKIKNARGELIPRRICRNCGYAYSIQDIKDPISHNRAARIFNLDDRKIDNLIEDALLFGFIERSGDDLYKPTSLLKKQYHSPYEHYHRIPLYRFLIENLGSNPKRSDFEKTLELNPDLKGISATKKNILWLRYQKIATEIFICEKTCKFSRTCKKRQPEIMDCDIVKKAKEKKKEWRVDIVI